MLYYFLLLFYKEMPKITSSRFCKFENELLKSKFVIDIKNSVQDKLKEINIQQFRTNPELIKIVCNIIWNACNDLKIKEDDLDKKQLVIDILTPLLGYTPSDILFVKTQIDYVINNNQIVIIKNSFKIAKSVWRFFKRTVSK
jgi:hypothetical protein